MCKYRQSFRVSLTLPFETTSPHKQSVKVQMDNFRKSTQLRACLQTAKWFYPINHLLIVITDTTKLSQCNRLAVRSTYLENDRVKPHITFHLPKAASTCLGWASSYPRMNTALGHDREGAGEINKTASHQHDTLCTPQIWIYFTRYHKSLIELH